MRLNRNNLRRMILNEIRQLNEESGGYDALSAEDKLYAQVGFVDRAIDMYESEEGKHQKILDQAKFRNLFYDDCKGIKAAIENGKPESWQSARKGGRRLFNGAVEKLQKDPSDVPGMLKRGKYIIDRTR